MNKLARQLVETTPILTEQIIHNLKSETQFPMRYARDAFKLALVKTKKNYLTSVQFEPNLATN